MDKRVERASNNSEANRFLLVTLILLFCFTLFISIQYIAKYYINQSPKNGEVIEIKTKDASASIINDGSIKKTITEDSFTIDNEIIIEKINTIELISNDKEESSLKFDVRYDITKNDFKENIIPSNKSEVLVRFSYSYDNEEWIYINNVISTNTSNISALIGNNYDIAGLVTKLNVVTDFEITANNQKPTKMYWRSETIFKNLEDNETAKDLNANFTILYKSDN